jgi:hypothetical protein
MRYCRYNSAQFLVFLRERSEVWSHCTTSPHLPPRTHKQHTSKQPNANSTSNKQRITPKRKAKRLDIIIFMQREIALQLLGSGLTAHIARTILWPLAGGYEASMAQQAYDMKGSDVEYYVRGGSWQR